MRRDWKWNRMNQRMHWIQMGTQNELKQCFLPYLDRETWLNAHHLNRNGLMMTAIIIHTQCAWQERLLYRRSFCSMQSACLSPYTPLEDKKINFLLQLIRSSRRKKFGRRFSQKKQLPFAAGWISHLERSEKYSKIRRRRADKFDELCAKNTCVKVAGESWICFHK